MFRGIQLTGLLALSLLVVGSVASAAERRIVVFQPDTSPEQRVALTKEAGGIVVRELPLINAVVIEHPTKVTTTENKLRALSEVKRVDPDPKIYWLEMADEPGVDFPLPPTDEITGHQEVSTSMGTAGSRRSCRTGYAVGHQPRQGARRMGDLARAGRQGRGHRHGHRSDAS